MQAGQVVHSRRRVMDYLLGHLMHGPGRVAFLTRKKKAIGRTAALPSSPLDGNSCAAWLEANKKKSKKPQPNQAPVYLPSNAQFLVPTGIATILRQWAHPCRLAHALSKCVCSSADLARLALQRLVAQTDETLAVLMVDTREATSAAG
jgi:hypothetical protein